MKKKGHPAYQEVLFIDSSTDHKFVCGSTLQPKEKQKFEGKEYPVHLVSVSSSSHPFFTGSQKFIDTEGRVDKFTKKYAKKKEDSKKEIEKRENALKATKRTKKKK
jgi:large subunit ribosomal protein L31